VEKWHGRIGSGRAWRADGWPDLAAFGAVDMTRETRDGTAAETRYS